MEMSAEAKQASIVKSSYSMLKKHNGLKIPTTKVYI